MNEKIKEIEVKFHTKQNFNINKLKDTVEIAFYDDKRKCLIKDKEYIRKFSSGITKAEFWGPAGCGFYNNMDITLKSGEVIRCLVAGDACDTLFIDGNVFEIGNEMRLLIHEIANKCDFNWWPWENK
jgi:hypothetical protein